MCASFNSHQFDGELSSVWLLKIAASVNEYKEFYLGGRLSLTAKVTDVISKDADAWLTSAKVVHNRLSADFHERFSLDIITTRGGEREFLIKQETSFPEDAIQSLSMKMGDLHRKYELRTAAPITVGTPSSEKFDMVSPTSTSELTSPMASVASALPTTVYCSGFAQKSYFEGCPEIVFKDFIEINGVLRSKNCTFPAVIELSNRSSKSELILIESHSIPIV